MLVVGWDGVPLELIKPWAEAGYLPNIQALMREGAWGHLESTVPPTSGPSWSTFATGKNPGKTGIYDFLHRKPNAYEFPPVNATMRDGQAIWSILSERGQRVAAINVPLSYPVDKVNGAMISGWMTPFTARDFAHPPGLIEELRQNAGEYHIYPLATFVESARDKYMEACFRLMDSRTRAVEYLLSKEAWDFFMVVYFDTDRLLHQVWHYLDATHPWSNGRSLESGESYVRRYFERLDEKLGRILSYADEDTTVIVLSDHGMGAAHYFIILNLWLLQQGYLVLKDDAITRLKRRLWENNFTLVDIHKLADRLQMSKHAEYKSPYAFDRWLKKIFLSFNDVDWSKSRAYSYGRHYGNIYVNLKGREPQGIVQPGAEQEALLAELEDRLKNFIHPVTKRPIVGKIAGPGELFHGPYTDNAPDLILLPNDETDIFFGLADFSSTRLAEPVYRYSGMHRPKGMLFMKGKNIKPGASLNNAAIQDMAPSILYAMGQGVPNDMDGRVLAEVFDESFLERHPVRQVAAPIVEHHEVEYAEDEAKQVEERLRALGYL